MKMDLEAIANKMRASDSSDRSILIDMFVEELDEQLAAPILASSTIKAVIFAVLDCPENFSHSQMASLFLLMGREAKAFSPDDIDCIVGKSLNILSQRVDKLVCVAIGDFVVRHTSEEQALFVIDTLSATRTLVALEIAGSICYVLRVRLGVSDTTRQKAAKLCAQLEALKP